MKILYVLFIVCPIFGPNVERVGIPMEESKCWQAGAQWLKEIKNWSARTRVDFDVAAYKCYAIDDPLSPDTTFEPTTDR